MLAISSCGSFQKGKSTSSSVGKKLWLLSFCPAWIERPKCAKKSSSTVRFYIFEFPLQDAVVFVVGGGNYVEYTNLSSCARSKTSSTPKRMIYGCTDVVNADQFLGQVSFYNRSIVQMSTVVQILHKTVDLFRLWHRYWLGLTPFFLGGEVLKKILLQAQKHGYNDQAKEKKVTVWDFHFYKIPSSFLAAKDKKRRVIIDLAEGTSGHSSG